MTAQDVSAAFTTLSGEEALNVEKLVGGSPNPSYGVTTAKARYAVRLYPPAQAELQAALLKFLEANGYPVPAVVYEGRLGDRRLLAVSWVTGKPLAEALTQAPDHVQALGRAFGVRHAQLHALRIPSELKEVLPRLEVPCTGTALLHLDYHPLNALAEGSVVSGIIDWDNVRVGDPRADVARTLSILATDPAIRALPLDLRRGVRAFRRAYCTGYVRVAGTDALGGLRRFLAWAGDYMLRDLGKRYEAAGLEPVQRWTARFRSLG